MTKSAKLLDDANVMSSRVDTDGIPMDSFTLAALMSDMVAAAGLGGRSIIDSPGFDVDAADDAIAAMTVTLDSIKAVRAKMNV